MTEPKLDERTSPGGAMPSWLPYVLPMGLYMTWIFLNPYLGAPYLASYSVMVLVVTAALIYGARTWGKEIRVEMRVLLPAIAAGIVGIVAWVGITEYVPYPLLGKREVTNPFETYPDATLRNLFFGIRFFGLVIMVPIMEEVFWRSWMLRYATDQDKWASLPLGAFSMLAFFIVCGLFAGVHPEWLVAFLFAALMAGLLRYTKSLFACIVAHAVANLALGIYVLQTGDWKYW